MKNLSVNIRSVPLCIELCSAFTDVQNKHFNVTSMKDLLESVLLVFLFKGCIKVTSTIVSLSALNNSETFRDRGLVPKNHQ